VPKPEHQVDLMLDSGAYSAWRTGEKIGLEEYVQFLQDNLHLLTSYVSLDVIAGQRGRGRSVAELEEGAKKGFKNYELMKKEGLDPIHIFHGGERWYWLEKLLDSGAQYIGIGTFRGRGWHFNRKYFDTVFSFLAGKPVVKVHGFGMTSVPFIFRYPWTSVDSASWVFFSAYGFVLVPPMGGDGKYNFGVTPEVISVSKRPGKKSRGMHIEHLGKNNRDYVLEYLKWLIGRADLDELNKDYYLRQSVNALYFKKVSECYVPINFQSRGLFAGNGMKSNQHINIVFAFGKNVKEGSIVMQEAGIRSRLYSYYNIWKGIAPFDLEEYVRVGFIEPSKKKAKVEK
jgi:hypothetical protein